MLDARHMSEKSATSFRSIQIVCSVVALAVLLLYPIFGAASGPDMTAKQPMPSVTEVAKLMAEAATVNEVALSPDGRFVAYTVSWANVETNQHTSELLLRELDTAGGPRGSAKQLVRSSGELVGPRYDPSWSPDGKGLSYFDPLENEVRKKDGAEPARAKPAGGGPTLVRYDLVSGRALPIPFKGTPISPQAQSGSFQNFAVSRIPANYQWSPTGRFIAFISRLPAQAKPLGPRYGVVQTPDLTWRRSSAASGLFVLDVASGALELITSDTMVVRQFSWSPDERELVIAVSQINKPPNLTDLSVVNRTTRAVRILTTGPGIDNCPSWSPDGKWIAFASPIPGTDATGLVWPSMVAADSSGVVKRFGTGEEDPALNTLFVPHWAPDSRSFYYAASHRMAGELVRVDTAQARLERVFPSDDIYTDRGFSFSADGRRVAFLRSSYATPWELYIHDISQAPKAVTNLVSAFPIGGLARIDRVSWPSRDGKFTIHGLLLTPKDAWRPDGTGTKMTLPTVAFNYGGPGMVSSGFDSDGQSGGLLPLAVRGYAVLAPNTRGRGGYGQKFFDGMRSDQSYLRLPYEDMMAGLDMLVQRGIADPQKLGVYGHSYGANVTAFAITQTDRLKAAVVHEGITLDFFYDSLTIPGSVDESRFLAHGGPPDPFDDGAQNAIIRDSVRFQMRNIQTPTLLTYGAQANADTTGERLYKAMFRLKVPTEFVVFDAPHSNIRPAHIADELSRVGAWFDYWLRDLPYPDQARAREYAAWRANRRAKQRSGQP